VKPLRVVIADDHPYYRRGLARSLQARGIEVVAEAPNGAAAIRAVEDTAPDVVVMDLKMPGMSGIEATRLLTARFSTSRVVILSVSNDEQDVADAVLAGACGYVLKESSVDEIAAAIHAVAAGETHVRVSRPAPRETSRRRR
jgi:DNA-binding NarL/FixJ family response regulator